MEELEGSLLDPRITTTSSQNQNISVAVPVANSDDSDGVTAASASFIRATPVEVTESAAASSTQHMSVGSAAAAPSEYFEYTKEQMQQDELLHQAEITQATTVAESELSRLGINDDNYNNHIPMAPALGRYEDNSPSAIEYETKAKIRMGSDIGRVHAIQECERIAAINREAQAKVYHEKARNDVARAVAKQRVKEGFDARLREDKYLAKSQEKEQMKQDSAFVKKGGKGGGVDGGYDVAEYQTGSGSGYEVAEYQTADYDNSDYQYKSVYD